MSAQRVLSLINEMRDALVGVDLAMCGADPPRWHNPRPITQETLREYEQQLGCAIPDGLAWLLRTAGEQAPGPGADGGLEPVYGSCWASDKTRLALGSAERFRLTSIELLLSGPSAGLVLIKEQPGPPFLDWYADWLAAALARVKRGAADASYLAAIPSHIPLLTQPKARWVDPQALSRLHTHRLSLNPPLTEERVAAWEHAYAYRLPEGFRRQLSHFLVGVTASGRPELSHAMAPAFSSSNAPAPGPRDPIRLAQAVPCRLY